jgi:uncharacterized membrane protein
MFPKLRALWHSVKNSLWAVPLSMVLGAAVVAVLTVRVHLTLSDYPAWFLYSGTSGDVPEYLSSLVGAMITMATLAISITVVVLTLAAQQLGPRLIRSFISDWRTQVALGLFLSTVVYLLMVLRATYGIEYGVPNLAVTVGMALVLCSVATLVVFVHHLARSIIADNMIERVGADLDAAATLLLPSKDDEQAAARPPSIRSTGAPLSLPRGGYVQAIDFGRLVAATAEQNAVIELAFRAGHHVIAGTKFGWVSPPRALNADLQKTFEASVLLGGERTPVQDLEFSLRQLVEMALRALSPGISDPFTALAAIDRLARSLERILHLGSAQSVWQDTDGFVRVIVPVSSFEGLVDAAFNQIRQLSPDRPAILIRLADNLGQLAAQADGDRRATLLKHILLVRDAARREVKDQHDLQEIEARIQAALEEAEAGPLPHPARRLA